MSKDISIQEYIDLSWDKVQEYIDGVQKDTIKTSKWIKLAVERFIDDAKFRDDLEYRVDKVENVFKFLYFININKDNVYSRFELLPYQAFIIAALFGPYYKGSNKRKYRYAFLFQARKNGKSVFAAALQLYFLVADGVADPQSLLLASTREQAGICLDYATGIINNSPALAKRLEAQRYKIIFKDRQKGGFSKVLASNANRLDGYSASGAILDEVHAYPNDDLFNVIKSSILARENPMIFLVSTAGFSLTSFCYNYMLYSQNVLNGTIEDDTLFPMLYTLDSGDDYRDEANWYKSNPAMGEINHIEDLRAEFNQSVFSTTQLNNFLTKHLNVFVDQEASWISNEVIEAKFRTEFNIEDLYGLDAYIGMDLSATRDLSSVVVVIHKDNKYYVIPYFFMANDAEKFLRSGGINLKDWMKNGDVILCDTPTIDYDLIVEKFEWLSTKFNIRLVHYDPFNSAGIITDLHKLGLPLEPFKQNAMNFNEPLKALEKFIFNDDIIMMNPVLKWNLNNVVIYMDSNGNIKIMKNKSLDSVDGAVSLAMAIAAYQFMNKGSSILEGLYN